MVREGISGSSPPPAARGQLSLIRTAVVALVAAIAGGTVVALPAERTQRSSAGTRTLAAPATAAGPAGASWAAIAKRAARGVVEITVTRTRKFKGVPRGSETESVFGTGFFIDRRGSIVTNEHVTQGGGTISVQLADGTVTRGALMGADASTDLAVVRVRVATGRLHPLTFGRASTLELGAPVLAIGAPFGYAGSASAGIVSGFGRQIESPNGYLLADAIQTDAAVNHGNSGGPLLDAVGEVVGINAQLANSGVNGNVGVAFAIPIDAGTRRVIRQLSTSGTARHAWLGISGTTLDARLAAALGLARRHGVLITGIAPGSPADRAGLTAGSHLVRVGATSYCAGGDVVAAVDGVKIASESALQNALERYRPGARVELVIVHLDGSQARRSLTLVTQPAKRPAIASAC